MTIQYRVRAQRVPIHSRLSRMGLTVVTPPGSPSCLGLLRHPNGASCRFGGSVFTFDAESELTQPEAALVGTLQRMFPTLERI